MRDTLLSGSQIIRTRTSGSTPVIALTLVSCDFDPSGSFTGYSRTPRFEMSVEYNVSGRAFIRGNPYLKHNFSWQLQLDAAKFQRLQTLINSNVKGSVLAPGLVLEDGFQPTGVGANANSEVPTLSPPTTVVSEGSNLSVYDILITSVSYDWLRNGLYSVRMEAQEL